MVVMENAWLVALGALAGAAAGALFGYGMRSILFGIGAADPTAFGVALAVMTLVMFAASYVPARRATKVDPLASLRAE
jgi:putative ABC transport system permease protein